ncbi:DedA family protein [Speluncibacter jeojiensis]|uniref:DedA family protein n=1 Tax=Speluncibacter jeojiensis TaxID=2710754 RepID=UPI00240EEFA3|nr:DedA family protein [Rhodococcus sp. D2-41]
MPLTSMVDKVLGVGGPLVLLVVGLLVFAEDALFFGFVIPGETAAVLGGVVAARGHVLLPAILAVVVVAAILGDSVGFEVGRKFGPRLMQMRVLERRRKRLDDAQDFLRRRGGWAVFLGRFVAFFRAVMPALAGTAQMPYRRFLAFNALGGAVWGVAFVLLGYLAGNSYAAVEKTAGRGVAIGVAAVVVVALVVWRIREHRAGKSRQGEQDGEAGAGVDGFGEPGQAGDRPDPAGAPAVAADEKGPRRDDSW